MLSMETHGYESQVWSELLIGWPDSGGRGLVVAAAVSVSQASVHASEEEDERKSRADFWSRWMQRLTVTCDQMGFLLTTRVDRFISLPASSPSALSA